MLRRWSNSLLSGVNVATLLVCFVIYYILYYYLKRRRRLVNIPPGPKPWPIVGNFGGFLIPSFVRKRFGKPAKPNWTPVEALREQAARYGDVFSLFVGAQLIVVLNGYDVIRDALLNHAEVFSDRPDIPAVTIMTKRKGIVFAPYGSVWRKHRKFCHASLRTFGLGKLSLEPCILQGLETIKSELMRPREDDCKGGVDLTLMVSNAVSNVICSLALGERFPQDDRQFATLLGLMVRGLELCVNSPAVLINVFPPLYHLPFGVFGEIRQVERDISAFLKRLIAKHRDTLDPDNPRDLVDMYLAEMAAQRSAGVEDNSFDEDYLFYIIGDLFIAGTDTTTNSLLWIMLYLVVHPNIQEKIQAEVDEVVGRGRVPSLTDRGSLPFTEATIMEVQRLTTVVPLAIPHMVSKTTDFRGFTIPRGTVLLPNLWSVHRDPAVWDQPDSFRPERFLDEEGKLARKECFMPFGIGRRVCMGEQLAKMELFLMVTGLLQAFTFRLPAGTPSPPMHGRFGLTLAPCSFTVCATPRG
ncbi:cytochrome P450 2U1 [Corythoichthys intestinalis]|uniref:cytochrome P450 2U1 n=1 Tax=Corythoichthys intestinalis TaxID=161448 RepID=UPI0025A4EE83|nr:cytochrome P450 2U1 [Corythoichthys intestinalis]XP_061792320.1 cytochrome P450 2U1-like [Nerophis lumbriciformis]